MVNELLTIYSGNVHNITGNVNSGRNQDSPEIAYTTAITTFIDHGNGLGE
jgi:hypothetical protein